MTTKEKAELQVEITATVKAAVAEAMKNHKDYCRFTDQEAARLHQVPQDLDRQSLFTLSRMVRAWDRASVWIGRAMFLAFLALLAWGLAKLATRIEIPNP